MLDAISKADVLIEALGWIRRFRGKITVIKLGGSAMEDPTALQHTLIDVVFMESVGMRPVVVHGAGAAISRAMETAGLQPTFLRGRRVTDAATLQIVERVLAREINEHIAEQINRLEGQAQSLNFSTTNVLFGKPLGAVEDQGERIDLGFVGDVSDVDTDTVQDLCARGIVPVIPSMCLEPHTGQKLNVNADTAAAAVAEALGAEKLVFLSDVNGVRARRDDPESLFQTLNRRQARELMASGQIEAGMIPKVESCLAILDQGVKKVHIVDGRLRHSLLLEIYTNQGVGTQFVLES
jgi:acetylglutamate kinase